MSDDIQPVECPLCFQNFSSMNIESHARSCKGNTNNNDIVMPPKRRKTASFEGNVPKKVTSKSPWRAFKTLNKAPAKPLETEDPQAVTEICSSHSQETKSNNVVSLATFLAETKPLAEIARPKLIEDYVGQTEVLGKQTALSNLLKGNTVPSMIFWGPPGCGKTTLAHIVACKSKNTANTRFVKLSATSSGKAEVQSAIKVANNEQKMFKRKTILFIDEIHRFNKLQQDTFLPHVENGTIILLGATTENPSFALNSALLSRCRVIVLHKLEANHVRSLLDSAISKHLPFCTIQECEQKDGSSCSSHNGNTDQMNVSTAALNALANLCDGDARIALNCLQMTIQSLVMSNKMFRSSVVTVEHVKSCLQRSHILYDRTGDEHYAMLSALHKSVRGCDENAALYWLTRMMLGGEDPKVIARRLIRMASEDIGLADPNALNIAVSTYSACQYVGMPECDVTLAQCVVYLCRCPKSVEVYKALETAKQCIKNHDGPLPSVPLHIQNASTKLMKDLGYGKGYDYTAGKGEQEYLPKELADINFFNV